MLLTKLCSCSVAAVVPRRSLVVAIILSLFISTEPGTVGVGKDDIFMENGVFDINEAALILNPILRLTTSAAYVLSFAPCTIYTLSGRSWKLSNYLGKVMYSHCPILIFEVHVALMVKNVDCNTSIFDESIPFITIELNDPIFYGSMMVSVKNRSVY